MPSRTEIEVKALTASNWDDLVELFGPERGAAGRCWCMFWRQTKPEWKARTNEGNRSKLRRLIKPRAAPGLVAYRNGKPVGWTSVAPRQQFPRLNGSQYLGPVDDKPVWAIVCFYIRRGHRKSGVATALLDAAVKEASKRGARIVEGYPLAGSTESGDAWTGVPSMFERAGFREVERRHPSRPIMRKTIRAKKR
jgi:GNAT superfamily N-acetyltransferase